MASRTADIRCDKCNNLLTVDDYLELEQVHSHERNMGAEVFYEAIMEIECTKCSSEIEIKLEYSEYPVGFEGESEYTVSGADFIRGFQDVDVAFENEIYNFDEDFGLYTPEPKKIILNLTDSLVELTDAIYKKPTLLYDLEPRRFEEFIAHIFSNNGFSVELTKATRDGGRDIIAIRSDMGIPSKYIIECKRYAKNNPVCVDVVRSLYGVQMAEGANKSIVATTSRFTKPAIDFVSKTDQTQWHMDLRDYYDIIEWVKNIKS